MNRTERRSVERVVRAAIDGTSSQIRPGDLAPLHLMSRHGAGAGLGGAGLGGTESVRTRRGLSRPVAAMAAAAAVVTIAAASFGAASALRADRAEMTGPPPAGGALALIPRYSVALTTTAQRLQVAKVINSVTRKVVATISAPKPYNSFNEVTEASGGSTFVLDAQVWKYVGKHHAILEAGPSRMFAVTLRQAQAPGPLTVTPLRLPVLPARSSIESLALSPAGTKLAVAFDIGSGALNYQTSSTRLWIYTMATGTLHKFHSDWQIGHGIIDPTAMSWSADDRTLSLDAYTGGTGPFAVELFDATATRGSISSHSRPIVHITTNPTTSDAYLLPDGSKVVLGVYSPKRRNMLAEVSTATGRTVKTIVLNPPPVDGAVPSLANVQWTNSSGSVMILVFANRALNHIGQGIHMLLHNGKLSLLPVGIPNAIERAW
jgi:hypothetical protein